jgi:hypothetical protein
MTTPTDPRVTVAARVPEALAVQLDNLVHARQVAAGSRRRLSRSDVIRDLIATAVSTPSPERTRVRSRKS